MAKPRPAQLLKMPVLEELHETVALIGSLTRRETQFSVNEARPNLTNLTLYVSDLAMRTLPLRSAGTGPPTNSTVRLVSVTGDIHPARLTAAIKPKAKRILIFLTPQAHNAHEAQ
jgi:hypothetical protein